MDQKDFTKRYARHMRSTSAEAADRIDGVVNDLLRRLRAGKPAEIPGFGTLLPVSARPSTAEPVRISKAGREPR